MARKRPTVSDVPQPAPTARSQGRVARALCAALALCGLALLAAAPTQAAAPPFQLYLPIPVGATVQAGGPHPFSGAFVGTRSTVDIGPGGGGEMAVHASAGGTAHVNSASGWSNCWVSIDHADGWQTRYYHLKNVDTAINGQSVAAGQRIGDAGQPGTETCGTGTAGFRHVHFAIYRNGAEEAIDGTSIGGYTVHQTGGAYCGYWTRDSDGAVVANAQTACQAVPSLVNDRVTPPGPDPDPVQKPSCSGVTQTVAHGAPTGVQLTCTGESLAYVAPSTPAHGSISNFDAGTGRLTYTPAAGYTGPDSFTFTASNDGGTSDPATATITVLPPKPTCAPVTKLVATDTPTPIPLTCSGQTFSYAAPSTPAHGTISALDPATGALIYTPAPGYTGPDSFTFTATNVAGSSEPATASITVSTPPKVSNLRARATCIRSVRLNGAPVRGSSGLSFSFTLDQPAQVLYELYRRDDSTRHKHCPRNPTGHTQDTFTPQGSLTGPGTPGTNTVVLGRSALAARRPTATRRSRLRQSLRAGRHTVRLAAITDGRTLSPGTYVLLVSATNALGQRSNLAHAKFFALGNRPPRYVEAARTPRRAVS